MYVNRKHFYTLNYEFTKKKKRERGNEREREREYSPLFPLILYKILYRYCRFDLINN